MFIVLSSLASAQREDTTRFVITPHEESKELIIAQVYKTFQDKMVGMLPFFCEDSVEVSFRFSEDSLASELMVKGKAMDQMRSFFEHIPYVGFREFSGSTVYGPIVFLKLYMDIDRPDAVVYVYFVVNPCEMKIEKILFE